MEYTTVASRWVSHIELLEKIQQNASKTVLESSGMERREVLEPPSLGKRRIRETLEPSLSLSGVVVRLTWTTSLKF